MNSTTAVFNSAADVPADLWKQLQHKNCFLDKTYLNAVEEAGYEGLSFYYIFKKNKSAKEITFHYFQIVDLSKRDLNSIINLEPYGQLFRVLSHALDKFLFGIKRNKPHYLIVSGNILLSGDYGVLSSDRNSQSLLDSIDLIKKELNVTGKVVATIVKDLSKDDPLLNELKFKKFLPMVMDPIMEFDIRPDWKNFDDYLNALSSKYRVRAKNVMKKITGVEIRDFSPADFTKHREELYQLYKGVQQKSPVRLLSCKIDYLFNLLNLSNDRIIFRTFWKDNSIIAFMTVIMNGNELEAHHIGFDYKLNKNLAIYQNILYHYIEIAIQHQMHKISFGRTALEIKSTVGAYPVNFQAFIRLENKIINSLLCNIIPEKSDEKWIQRNPFK
ncbi:MAG: hypothetical protein ACKOX3_11295 [Bacteroidota bacterium]